MPFIVSAAHTASARLTSCVFPLLLVAAGGCGRGPSYSLAPVSGSVKVDGKPAEGVEVAFIGGGMTGIATTDAEGRYSLPRGAVVGHNRVALSKFVGGTSPADTDGIDAEQLRIQARTATGTGTGVPRQLIPPKFSDRGRTELRFDLPTGGTSAADFNITTP